MGRCGPVFLAFLLSCFGINIFIKERSGCEPLISSLIFLTSIMVVLWQLRLYPASFRKLSIHFLYVVEFFFSAFLMEHLMVHFWTPLEERMTEFLPKISDFEDEILKQGGWACGGLFTFLRWDETLVGASYLLSLFFLFGALHGIRALDFRLNILLGNYSEYDNKNSRTSLACNCPLGSEYPTINNFIEGET
ncbi:uncharacterized protein [Onthophagus taurus]|uniref:uncharacterized protein isoform X2 n=1 Tax=Onthophagus taurus TaxID=166361 RepID=UPI000C20738E|nr:uncharacterized protein LOC111414075 isoform X2 [Onthophagus taurus]